MWEPISLKDHPQASVICNPASVGVYFLFPDLLVHGISIIGKRRNVFDLKGVRAIVVRISLSDLRLEADVKFFGAIPSETPDHPSKHMIPIDTKV